MKPLKILNLNIWNYNQWEERKPKIVSFIKKHNPDIVTLQEVRDDLQFNKKGNNQAKQINQVLDYPYYAFYSVTNKRKERPERYKKYCTEGTAVLSKFPILQIDKKKLKKHSQDIHNCGNLFVKIKAKRVINLVVVHFSNKDLFSLLHLKETLKQIKDKKTKPVIVGDFNMWDQKVLNGLTKQDYVSSMSYKRYISYPIRKWTLDYILIPKGFRFKSLKCEGDLSDHKSLIAEILI